MPNVTLRDKWAIESAIKARTIAQMFVPFVKIVKNMPATTDEQNRLLVEADKALAHLIRSLTEYSLADTEPTPAAQEDTDYGF